MSYTQLPPEHGQPSPRSPKIMRAVVVALVLTLALGLLVAALSS